MSGLRICGCQGISLTLLSLSLVLLGITATQIYLAQKDDLPAPYVCQLYLCDDLRLTQAAYQEQLDNRPASLSSATGQLSDLLVRDPGSPRRWADFGDALAQAGAINQARLAYDRAIGVGASSADILVSAAAFYLRYGDRRAGLKCATRILEVSPQLADTVFGHLSTNDVSARELLASSLPITKGPANLYLRYFMARADRESARLFWRWMMGNRLSDIGTTVEYTNFLLPQNCYWEAVNLWRTQVGDQPLGYQTTEFLFNGGFESAPIPGASFDWAITASDQFEALRAADAFSGLYALKVAFHGLENLDFNHVRQMAVLAPGRYELDAYMRAQDVSTDQGVFLRVYEEADRHDIARTGAVLGTIPWTKVSTSFVVSKNAELVGVALSRHPSNRFDSKINGTVWIDQVSLRKLE